MVHTHVSLRGEGGADKVSKSHDWNVHYTCQKRNAISDQYQDQSSIS